MTMQFHEDSRSLLTLRETAMLLGVSEKWLYRNRRSKKKMPYIKLGRMICYQQSDIEKWLKQHKET